MATRESFSDGWFTTGDMAIIEGGYFRIMGRLSVDIIKSGGYKLSALLPAFWLLAAMAAGSVVLLLSLWPRSRNKHSRPLLDIGRSPSPALDR